MEIAELGGHGSVPLLLKIMSTLFVFILVPIYWKKYGPSNFLWLSDIGLFMTILALWLESPLLISMAVVGIFPMELAWIIDYFYQLLTGRKLFGLTAYMFERERPLFLRGLSLFHVVMPVIWIWALWKWGYDPRALKYQSAVLVVAMLSTYLLTPPEKNINWVFLPKEKNWKMPPLAWLASITLGILIIVQLPMHWLLTELLP